MCNQTMDFDDGLVYRAGEAIDEFIKDRPDILPPVTIQQKEAWERNIVEYINAQIVSDDTLWDNMPEELEEKAN